MAWDTGIPHKNKIEKYQGQSTEPVNIWENVIVVVKMR